MSAIEFRDVTKEYRRKPVLEGLNFAIEAGTFTVIFGAPGCGKSVLLRLMIGLEKPTSGHIFMRDQEVTNVAPGERNIGYVPQMFALYPHYKVYDNIAYPLNLMGLPHRDADSIVRQAAEMLHITHLLQKYPDQLSGGEKQRVALARGIVKQTNLYVLDDPLTGLDFKLREQLFDDLQATQRALRATFVYTTSDPLEALMLAEHIIVLDGGRVIEAGPLGQVYAAPQHARTMELLGFPTANFLKGTVETRDGQVWCKTALFEFRLNGDQTSSVTKGQEVSVAVRPQALKLNPEQAEGLCIFPAQVVLQEDLGGELVVHLESGGLHLLSVVRHDQAHLFSDSAVQVGIDGTECVLYAPESGQRIGQGAK